KEQTLSNTSISLSSSNIGAVYPNDIDDNNELILNNDDDDDEQVDDKFIVGIVRFNILISCNHERFVKLSSKILNVVVD
ncbi:unnamed protein product, partial [Rotaria sp. Silwood1]